MQKFTEIIFGLLLLLSALNCLIESDTKLSVPELDLENNITEIINIDVEYAFSRLGYNRYFYFSTTFNDKDTNYFDISDIEEKTSFNTLVQYRGIFSTVYSFKINCRFWKPINDNLKIICRIDDSYRRSI